MVCWQQIFKTQLRRSCSFARRARVRGTILIPTTPPSLIHFGYEDSIETSLIIIEEYPEKDITFYSEKLFLINRERAIIEPEGDHLELHQLLYEQPENFTPESKYNFIFLEKRPCIHRVIKEFGSDRSSSLITDTKRWINEYEMYHDNIKIYFESENIIVYLIVVE